MKAKIKKYKGFSYLEVVVSLGIMMGVIQIVSMGLYHTVRSYQNLKEIEEATLEGKEVMQDMIRILEKSEYKEADLLECYLKSKGEKMQPYEYQCILIEDLEPGSTLTWEQIEQGMHFTSGERFEPEIFKRLYEESALTIRKTNNKTVQPVCYEGIVVQSTPSRPIVLKESKVMEQQRVVIDSELVLGGSQAVLRVHTKTLDLNEKQPIFILWEGIEHLKGKQLNIEWVNDTPCDIILGLVGDTKGMEGIHFSVRKGGTNLMVKYLQERPCKELSYLLMEAVIKREEKDYKILKTYVAMQ